MGRRSKVGRLLHRRCCHELEMVSRGIYILARIQTLISGNHNTFILFKIIVVYVAKIEVLAIPSHDSKSSILVGRHLRPRTPGTAGPYKHVINRKFIRIAQRDLADEHQIPKTGIPHL